jgi:glycosyltransferase involved in cell wall biosynthesis
VTCRVLLLTSDYPPAVWSGIGVAVARQARALAARGLEVVVMIPGQPSSPAEDGPAVHSLAGPRFPVDPRRFDIVHLHSLALSEAALELSRRCGLRLVYTVHSLLDRELEAGRQETTFWCAVQRTVLARSHHVIFLNRPDREEAVTRMPGLAGRSSIVPHGLPPPTAGVSGVGTGAPIVYAGRFARSKGLDLLAAAVPRILEVDPRPVVLAGGHGDEAGLAAVGRLCAACGDRICIPGWLARGALDALFAGAALVLVPSEYEPFGLVALEAMRMGAPVLAAAVGGLPEVVGAGSGGRLVASRDPAVWAQAALGVLKDPEASGQLRRQGPPWVASRFNLDRSARGLEEAYAS